MTTDGYSFSENELYFFDDATPDDEFIWYAPKFSIDSNSRYELEKCLSKNRCYKFFFFDSFGDGFLSGGLTLKWDGKRRLRINPGDRGDRWQFGDPTRYWSVEMGKCDVQS